MGSIFLYGSIIIVTSILAECSVKVKSRPLKIFCALIMLGIPSFFSGVRYGIGTDYFNYVVIFKENKYNIENRIEKGYNLINKVISWLGGDEHVVFFVVSLLTLFFVYLALYERREKLSVGMGMFIFMLGYYQASFNNVRQLLAISILLFSAKYVFSKKLVKFLICILIASTIHTSAWFFFPVYFLYSIVEKKNNLFLQTVLWGSSMIVVAFADIILLKIFSIIPFLYPYAAYLNNSGASSDSHLVRDILNLVYIVPGLMIYNNLKRHDYRFAFYYMLLMFGFIIQFSSRGLFEQISIRASIVYFSTFTFVVPYYIRVLNSMKLIVISYCLFIVLTAIWLIYFFHFKNNETIPYQWILTLGF